MEEDNTIKFTVQSASSEDGKIFSAFNLHSTTSSYKRGWKSSPYCEYPQTLAIALVSITDEKIELVEILTSRDLRPSGAELFISTSDPSDIEAAVYSRVDHAQTDPNSGIIRFAISKLKVYIDITKQKPVTIMKFLFSKPSGVANNPYKQIHLLALNIHRENEPDASMLRSSFADNLDRKMYLKMKEMEVKLDGVVSNSFS